MSRSTHSVTSLYVQKGDERLESRRWTEVKNFLRKAHPDIGTDNMHIHEVIHCPEDKAIILADEILRLKTAIQDDSLHVVYFPGKNDSSGSSAHRRKTLVIVSKDAKAISIASGLVRVFKMGLGYW
ncbi:MAG: hypothetical protein COU47_02740 [Candidatus Niyogibacteria bacterium CG10_big_fil_rev_8_21_14_0_10_46_36]|uniref:Uncharacterized protein n=1 Tax=Candidatus Niyogibacteria bacterium CG10_big_fil_rev_8_21_14_0_10_46_36 TaxID=1974726 RepID=A0A2H0TD42_9BACT|nr:MAG: hypothetical protein COU47_02740 [Candidatus Niyogibacteria bacterium CG10_big_fil_rev_8_21_14_0_10_46_36]